jgi:hypothetical protein
MDKCSYEQFEGRYNKENGSVWFFGKCFNNIMEVVKIVNDVPTQFNDYIEIQGLTCFLNTQTDQVWYNYMIHDNTQKACSYILNLYNKGPGKTRIKRNKSRLDLTFMSLED